VGDVLTIERHGKERIVRITKRITASMAIAMCLGGSAAWAATGAAEQPYLTAITAAMDRMMAGMAVSPSDNVDHDFVAMMTPHHQGAIDMAVAELRYGHDEQLKRVAQEIIVDQQQEIAAMRLALGQPLLLSQPVPTQQGPAPHTHMEH
jgi:uncharacterized protein (DUF305 family)